MGNSPLFNSGGSRKGGFHFQAHLAVYVHAELGQWVYVLHARSSYSRKREKMCNIVREKGERRWQFTCGRGGGGKELWIEERRKGKGCSVGAKNDDKVVPV